MKTFLLFIAMLAFSGLNAQHGTVAAGGNATGQNGSVSYSIGQLDYVTVTGSTGTVTQGIQQPYEIFVVGVEENQDVSLEVSAYPNPTASMLNLKVRNLDTDVLSYKVYDQNGRLLLHNKLVGDVTAVPMQELPSGSYILKVFNKKTEIKTFKIIKK
jgi:spore coat protein U-like protein